MAPWMVSFTLSLLYSTHPSYSCKIKAQGVSPVNVSYQLTEINTTSGKLTVRAAQEGWRVSPAASFRSLGYAAANCMSFPN